MVKLLKILFPVEGGDIIKNTYTTNQVAKIILSSLFLMS